MQTSVDVKEYQKYLWQELSSRKSRNPNYSIRAFARDLKVSVTALSQVLSGKRDLSKRNALKIADRLSLSPETTRRLLREISQKPSTVPVTEYFPIEEDTFRVVSDWYHFAILNLARIPNSRATPEWIARRLGISRLEARAALLVLQRLGFLKIEKGKLVRTAVPIFFNPSNMPSALKKFQKQQLTLAQASLDSDAVEERYATTFILPADTRKLAMAKKLLLQLQKQVMEFLEDGEATEVYSLSVQLFPLTRKGDKK